MKRDITDLAASVNQRLLNLRDERKEDFQVILNRFALERFLYRVSKSPFADKLILKGAFAFELWGSDLYRPTRDADFLGIFEEPRLDLRRVFSLICRETTESDGLIFDPESISVDRIQELDFFLGRRVRMFAHLKQIRIPLQFDINLGGKTDPPPEIEVFPAILPFPPARILVYPRVLTVADKFHAMCKLGILNSRVKDYYDIYMLSRRFSFGGPSLRNGIRKIFDSEKTPVPSGVPDALSDAFGNIPEKRVLWDRFLRRIGRESMPMTFVRIIEIVRTFILPPGKSAAENAGFDSYWPAGGPWKSMERHHAD